MAKEITSKWSDCLSEEESRHYEEFEYGDKSPQKKKKTRAGGPLKADESSSHDGHRIDVNQPGSPENRKAIVARIPEEPRKMKKTGDCVVFTANESSSHPNDDGRVGSPENRKTTAHRCEEAPDAPVRPRKKKTGRRLFTEITLSFEKNSDPNWG
jgi:hypothetical protein